MTVLEHNTTSAYISAYIKKRTVVGLLSTGAIDTINSILLLPQCVPTPRCSYVVRYVRITSIVLYKPIYYNRNRESLTLDYYVNTIDINSEL